MFFEFMDQTLAVCRDEIEETTPYNLEKTENLVLICLLSEKALDNYHISDKFDILDAWLKKGLRGARGMPIGVQVHGTIRKMYFITLIY